MTRRFAILATVGTIALAACSDNTGRDGEEAVTDLDRVASDGAAEAAAKALPAGDFAELTLGAKIAGPRGEDVEGALSNAAGNFADIRSYVACPAGIDPCDPASAPAGTVFTYVHVVHPGEDNDPSTGDGEGNTSSDVERASEFRLTMPAHGFTGQAGYSKAEALAAIGAKADVIVTCHEGGIVWTVNAGDGGDQWEQAEPLTFYWQSTVPPAGPRDAYAIFANYTAAHGPGPYPAADEAAGNACTAPRAAG
ncbi:hypothetical protein [Pelagerythrobacter marinus]|uniref:hypothetical protein n=1 Tax=Pelagerythrobacter marinus TaxID=538382 RepID=UPI0020372187|nr:hypothetical protein [Pelagerythrobacter marinus]USA40533.1 hypothetical protein NCF86_05110 [Pelagerythrobacter marinus]WPZ08296.1 hypothetical protein T8T98_07245 [Pelagerythrobacter marinus]